MAPHSPTESPVEPRALIEAQVRECYGRVVYSHKTHEKCADILLARLSAIKICQITLSSITTAGFLAAMLGAGPVGAAVGAVVSTALLVLNAYTKSFDLGALAQKHRQAAADLWLVREKYLALITDLRIGKESVEKAGSRRDALLEELHGAYAGAPSTTVAAYKRAQKSLQQQGEMTFSDAGIDAFLPKELRKTQLQPNGDGATGRDAS